MKALIVKTFNYSVKILISLIVGAIICIGCGGGDDDPTPKSSAIEITEMTPSSPASLKYYESGPNDRVEITYTYNVTETEGVRIFVQPYTNGSISPGYVYTSSPLFKDSGSKDVRISVQDKNEEMVKVDQLRLAIFTSDAATIIREEFMDVDFTFSD